MSYRKGLNWGRTADPDETLCLQPVEMKIALSSVKTQDNTEHAYVTIIYIINSVFYRAERQSLILIVINVHRLFAEMTNAWEGCEKYFYRSWARRNAMMTALQCAVKVRALNQLRYNLINLASALVLMLMLVVLCWFHVVFM